MQTRLTPKRKDSTAYGTEFYPFYAGYSSDFVRASLTALKLPSEGIILDPWNGTGTTTYVSELLGFQSYGIDINPAMQIIARARLIDPIVASLLPQSLVKIADAEHITSLGKIKEDPLNQWFNNRSIKLIRSFQANVKASFKDKTTIAFFETALFRVIRAFSVGWQSSNPTWFKIASDPGELVTLTKPLFYEAVKENMTAMALALTNHAFDSGIQRAGLCKLTTASSIKLPIEKNSISCVITSPPYCTRIDYAIASRPELAVLNRSATQVDNLRRKMLGGPTIKDKLPVLSDLWGTTCISTLKLVHDHSSRASSTYYYKTYLHYFDELSKSLLELTRVVHSGGHMILVVQDSFYKEVHIDLPTIASEMLENFGWLLVMKNDHLVKVTKGAINAKSRRYREDSIATESVLHFIKG